MSKEGRARIFIPQDTLKLGKGEIYFGQKWDDSDVEYVRAQPPTADAETAAKEVVARWKRDIGKVVKYERMEADIATALSVAKQQGRDEQWEKDAKIAFDRGSCQDGCYCASDISEAIRSNQ